MILDFSEFNPEFFFMIRFFLNNWLSETKILILKTRFESYI